MDHPAGKPAERRLHGQTKHKTADLLADPWAEAKFSASLKRDAAAAIESSKAHAARRKAKSKNRK